MSHTYNYYIEKGFSPEYAEYFSKGRRTIQSVKANNDFTLTLQFDNNETRIFDVKPLLKKNTVFEPFLDFKNFSRVYLDDTQCVSWDIDPTTNSNEVWANKVDVCPDTCYVESKAM